MGIMVAFVEPLGESYPCHISEYLRTIVYKIPEHIVREGHLSPMVVKDTTDFRASIVTDPIQYLKEGDFTDQYHLDVSFPSTLEDICGMGGNESEVCIYVIVQFKEDMCSFPAVGGQCIKREHDATEFLVIADCDDAPAPRPNERMRTIDIVLTAAKVEFGVTEGIEKAFDARCYRTDSGACVYPIDIKISLGGLTVLSPMTLADLATKAEATGHLAAQIEARIASVRWGGRRRYIPEFGTRLEELAGALQLEPSLDDAYLRLWYLRLWDRLEEFGDAFRPRLQLSNDSSLVAEKDHRNDIAHRGVDKMDNGLLRSLQSQAFRIIKSHIGD